MNDHNYLSKEAIKKYKSVYNRMEKEGGIQQTELCDIFGTQNINRILDALDGLGLFTSTEYRKVLNENGTHIKRVFVIPVRQMLKDMVAEARQFSGSDNYAKESKYIQYAVKIC